MEIIILGLKSLVEWMFSQTFNVDALFWICYENLAYYISSFRREEFWQSVIGR